MQEGGAETGETEFLKSTACYTSRDQTRNIKISEQPNILNFIIIKIIKFRAQGKYHV
jgi:hypothetical protein